MDKCCELCKFSYCKDEFNVDGFSCKRFPILKLTKLNEIHSKVFLLLGGICSNNKIRNLIDKNKNNKNIRMSDNYIPDNQVQYYFNAADIVVFPFKNITMSSSVILALSFKKPIIIPRLGCLGELPEDIGIFYDSKEKNELYLAMKKALFNKRKLNYLGKNAYNYALKELNW
jgi:glycosyltransferase involved in cell wall biosynthesis